MILESKSEPQYKTVSFSDDSNKDFEKYIEYLIKTDKNFQKEIENEEDGDKVKRLKNKREEKLKNQIIKKVNKDWRHKESIYPSDTEYGKGYKMVVSGEGERVIFYDIYTDKKDKKHARVHKCPHYKDFIKDLEEKGIEPKKDADASLLLELLELERQDMVRDLKDVDSLPEDIQKDFDDRKKELEKKLESQKNPSKSSEKNSDEKFEEDTDEEGNPRQHKTGPQGGKYYRVKIDGKWGPWNSETNEKMKSVKSYITESKMVSLIDYLKKMVG